MVSGIFNNQINKSQLVNYYRQAMEAASSPEEAQAYANELKQAVAGADNNAGAANPITGKPDQQNQVNNNGLKAKGNCENCHGCGKCGKNDVKGKNFAFLG